jgi:regulatory protein
VTATSTESAWGPRDWSSHGGGGSPQEAPADRAPATSPTPGRAASGRAASAAGPRDTASADPASRARDICLRLLTGSARTRKQLADTLRRKQIPDEIAEQVLDRLTEVGLIDDAAYARSWVEQRQRSRGLARRALAGELRAKGVDSALVAEAVAEVDPDDEDDAARRLVERKLASTRGLDRQVRLRRLAGMLARRGYPEGLALRVVRAALDAEREAECEPQCEADDGFGDSSFEDDGFPESG